MSRSKSRTAPARRRSKPTAHQAAPNNQSHRGVEIAEAYKIEVVPIAELRPHPRNYRTHPEDQVAHLVESLKKHGFYRNVVVAKDNTLLAGHGIVIAAAKKGMTSIPVRRLNIDPDDAEALQVLVGDNLSSHLSEDNDRLLTELLKEIKIDDSLLGTGIDDMMLANMVMVTRPESEIKDMNEAAAWVGMPAYDEGGNKIQLIITFTDEAKRDAFVAEKSLEVDIKNPGRKSWSTRWPWTEREDKASIRFKEQEA